MAVLHETVTHLSHFCCTTTSRISLPHGISCKHQLTLSVSATAHHSNLFHTIATLILQQELRLHHSHIKSNATSLFPRVAQLIILSHLNMHIYIVVLKLSSPHTSQPHLQQALNRLLLFVFSTVPQPHSSQGSHMPASAQDSPNPTTNGSSLSHLLL